MRHFIDTRARLALTFAALAGAVLLAADRADAAFTTATKDGALVVVGDAASDKLGVRGAPSERAAIELDFGDDGSADLRLARSSVDRIVVRAGDGADRVRIAESAMRPAFPLTVDGGDGIDALAFEGGGAGEQFRLTPQGGGAQLTRDVGAVRIGLGGVERVEPIPLGGDDAVIVEDLTGTGVQEVAPDLAAIPGGSANDAGRDRLLLRGTGGADLVDTIPGDGVTTVLGLPATVTAVRGEPARDRLTIEGAAGDDRIDAGGFQTAFELHQDGGAGDDNLVGSARADVQLGGDGADFVSGRRGNDRALLGAGEDIFSASAGDGSDAVEGDEGHDRALLTGTMANERFDLTAAGARARLTRDGAAALDTGDLEALTVHAFGGADAVHVDDLSGTELAGVGVALSDLGVGADDVVTVDGTAGADEITVAGSGLVSGLAATVDVTGASAPGDRLEINTLAGADRVDGTDLSAAAPGLLAAGGSGNDVVLGGVGDDILDGGPDHDVLVGGAGDDLLLNGETVFDD